MHKIKISSQCFNFQYGNHLTSDTGFFLIHKFSISRVFHFFNMCFLQTSDPACTILAIVCLFGVFLPTQEFFHSYGDVTIAGEGLQKFDLCSALMAIEQ